MKRIVAILLSITLVLTSMNYSAKAIWADQSAAENYDWGTVSYLGSSILSYNNTCKMVCVNGNGNIDVIQHPGFASKVGVYVTFSDADFGEFTVNGTVTTEYAIQGAGIVFYLDAFNTGANDLVVKNSSGATKAEFYFNKNISGITETTVQNETTTSKSEIEVETIASNPVGSSTIAAPSGISVYNFYAQEGGYKFIFTPVENGVSYNVYVDNVSGPVANISKSKDSIDASKFAAFADGGLHSVYLATVDSEGNVSVKSSASKVRITSETNSTSNPTDISRIYVVTNAGTKGGADITKESKTAASLSIISSETGVNTVSDGGVIKRRGNSTSLADKPAYNITFNSKQTVFDGCASGKKWSLLTNAFDKSLLRSKLAFDFGNALGNVAASDAHCVDLYIDGVYKGNYLIIEPAESGRCGFSIDDSDTSDEIMFELEADRVEADQTYYTTGLGVRFVTNDPEGLDKTSTKYSSWVSNLATFESALSNTSSDDIFNYIDVDSFIDMYIVNELFETVDFGYSSVKYYIKDNAEGKPIIYAGPIWDFDLSTGNSSDANARNYEQFRSQSINKWFNLMMQHTTFKNKVIEKYAQMQPVIQNIYKDNSLGKSQINQLITSNYAARIRNYESVANGGAGWSINQPDSAEIKYYPYSYIQTAPYNTYNYDQHIEYLTNFLKNRNQWMCTQWGIDYTAYESETTEKATTVEETTTVAMPEEAEGLVVSSSEDKISVTFSTNANGQTYNIAIDGKTVATNIPAGTYSYDGYAKGKYKVTVTSNLNGYTSSGVSYYTNVNPDVIVAFDYDNTDAVAKDDMGYTYSPEGYEYYATNGTGTYTGSVNGTDLKHIVWSKSEYQDTEGNSLGFMPSLKATSKNNWTSTAYGKYTISTIDKTSMKMSIDIGATSDGPANYTISYENSDGSTGVIGTASATTAYILNTYTFDIPKAMENQTSTSIIISLTNTTTISGADLSGDPSGGYWAMNNLEISYSNGITTSSDIGITGYQMSSHFNNIDGNMGFRVIYEQEPLVEGKAVTEFGLIYGIVYGDTPITKDDMIYGSTSDDIKSFVATDEGKLSAIMGDSLTATYYARTMDCGQQVQGGEVSSTASTTKYFVRAYAKLSDDTIAYSKVYSFKVFSIADYLYHNNLVSNKNTFDCLYNKILKIADSNYKTKDFNWNNTIVK